MPRLPQAGVFPPQAHQIPDPTQQMLQLSGGKGLGQIVIRPGLDGFHRIFIGGEGRHQHADQIRATLQRGGGQLHPTHAFHAHIGQQQVGRLLLDSGQRRFASAFAHGPTTQAFQGQQQSAQDGRIVVHHQDAQFRVLSGHAHPPSVSASRSGRGRHTVKMEPPSGAGV